MTALVAFGIAGILTIGWPFLLTGLGLAFLAPFRRRPAILLPLLVAWMAAVVAWFLLTPWNCIAVALPGSEADVFECRNLLGMELIHGRGVAQAGLFWWPSALAAAGVGGAAWAALRWIVARRGRADGRRRLGPIIPRSEP